MNARAFVEELMAAVPEAFAEEGDRDFYLGDEPLSYPALGAARIWLEEHAIDVSFARRPAARLRDDHADAFRRFWAFVERQAEAAADDEHLATLLQIECFEGVGWVEDLVDHLGPRTRALLGDAQVWLAPYNGQVGRWAE